jgi:hypothetical protein
LPHKRELSPLLLLPAVFEAAKDAAHASRQHRDAGDPRNREQRRLRVTMKYHHRRWRNRPLTTRSSRSKHCGCGRAAEVALAQAVAAHDVARWLDVNACCQGQDADRSGTWVPSSPPRPVSSRLRCTEGHCHRLQSPLSMCIRCGGPFPMRGLAHAPGPSPNLPIVIKDSDTCTRASLLLEGEQKSGLHCVGIGQYVTPCATRTFPVFLRSSLCCHFDSLAREMLPSEGATPERCATKDPCVEVVKPLDPYVGGQDEGGKA